MDIWTLAFAIIALIVGVVVGYLYRKSNHEKEIVGAKIPLPKFLKTLVKKQKQRKKKLC